MQSTQKMIDDVSARYARGDTVQGVQATYDFDKNAGAISTIDLRKEIPLGAIITGVITDTPTNLTSGGSATVQILIGSQSIVAADAFDDFDAPMDNTLVGSAPIKITTKANVKIAIATAALTAGVLNIWINYQI